MVSLRGFSLTEIVLTLGVIGILLTISSPLYLRFQMRNELDGAVETVVSSFRRAQGLAQAGDQDATWGVSCFTGSITVFKGTDYATRDPVLDEVSAFPINISCSGITEVVFAKLTGDPMTYGITTLTNEYETRTITFSTKGIPSY